METKEYYLKYIFTMNITEDPDFVASWQKVEEALKRLDENQVERLFAEQHTSLEDLLQKKHELDLLKTTSYPHEESKIE